MRLFRSVFILLLSLAVCLTVSCKSGGGGGGGSSTQDTSVTPPNDQVPDNNIHFSSFQTPEPVSIDEGTALEMEIETESDAVVFYKIEAGEGVPPFKPCAGIIVPKKNKGTLISTLKTDTAGTYSYTLTLTDQSNKKTVKTFTARITNN